METLGNSSAATALTFKAPLDDLGFETLNAGDVLKGGTSTDDTLIIGKDAGAENFAQATITGVEKVVLNGGAIDVSQNLDVKSVSVNAAAATGLNVRADQTVMLNSVNGAEAITYTNVAGAADTTTVNLVNNAFGTGNLTIAGIENLTLDLSGKNTVSDMGSGLVATDLETLVFTGAGSYQGNINDGASSATIKSINAERSGAVDIKVAAADLDHGATHKFDAKLSAFADKFAIDKVTANDVIDGGLGDDTFVLSGTTIATAATAVGVKGFEIFEFTGAVKHDMSVYEANNDIKSIVVGAAVTGLTNVNEGADSIVFKADNAVFETLTVLNTPTIVLDNSENNGGNDGVDLTHTAGTGLTTDALALNVHSIAQTGHAASLGAANSIADITATGLKLVTITGNEYVDLAFVAGTAKLTEIDASALTNGAGAKITLGDMVGDETIKVIGSAGSDEVTFTGTTGKDAYTFQSTGKGEDKVHYTYAATSGTGDTLAINITAASLTGNADLAKSSLTVDSAANTALVAAGAVALNFEAGFASQLHVKGGGTLDAFGPTAIGDLKDFMGAGTALADGKAFASDANISISANAGIWTLQFDVNGDGVFSDNADYTVKLVGNTGANTLAYDASTGDFTFTAA